MWNLIAKERGLGAFLGETEIGSWVEEIGPAVWEELVACEFQMTASFHVNEWIISGFSFQFNANLCLVDLVETNYSANKIIADLFVSTKGLRFNTVMEYSAWLLCQEKGKSIFNWWRRYHIEILVSVKAVFTHRRSWVAGGMKVCLKYRKYLKYFQDLNCFSILKNI